MLIEQKQWTNLLMVAIVMIAFITQAAGAPISKVTGDSIPFGPPVKYKVGNNPHGICTADLNGDGAPDIVTANSLDDPTGDISVLINAGSGVFLSEIRYSTGGTRPHKPIAADLDGDTHMDIAVADPYANRVTIFRNIGTGAFVLDSNYTISNPIWVEASDLNSDGLVDIAVAQFFGAQRVCILTNTGNGKFAVEDSSYVTGNKPCALAAADFDGDNRPDLAVANSFLPGSSNTITILENDGGAFRIDSNYTVVERPSSVKAADLNNDNHADLVVTNAGTNVITVLMNDGLGKFNVGSTFAVGNEPADVVVADLDRDGHPDLVVANNGASYISVLRNNGDGTFSPATNYGPIAAPRSVVAVDFDGDSFNDIAVTENGTDSVIVFRNLYYLCGDPNRDGTVDISDAVCLIAFIFSGGPAPNPLAAGDANCDSAVDISDAVYLISYIFSSGPAPCACKSGMLSKAFVSAATVGTRESEGQNLGIDVSSSVAAAGLQLSFSVPDGVAITSVRGNIEGMDVFSGMVDGEYRVGLIDMTGKAVIQAGQHEVVTISYRGEGRIELKDAIVVGEDATKMNVTITNKGVIGNGNALSALPKAFGLSQNTPNPFNPTTEIAYSLPTSAKVRIEISNILGQSVRTLVDEYKAAGNYSVIWDGRDNNHRSVASGIYLYRLTAGEFGETRKMVLMK